MSVHLSEHPSVTNHWGGGAALVPWVGSPRMLPLGLPKRSIPKPDQHRKDIIQQKSLGTDVL